MAETKEAMDLAQRAVQGIEASPTTSRTQAGQSEPVDRERLVETINQVFALFRLNFHNQFYAAFPDSQQLSQIKRLWLESLSGYTPELILLGAKQAVERSEYLPTLNRMLECCQAALNANGVPSPRDAFMEACQKPSPRAAQTWSHAAVYLAGRDTDWFFLSNNPEAITWPVFQKHYQGYLEKLGRGEHLDLPELPATAHSPEPAMDLDARRSELEKLRRDTGL